MKLKKKTAIMLLLTVLGVIIPFGNSSTVWNSEITVKNYDWVVSVSRSHNFSSYESPFIVGSTNLFRGGIRLTLKSTPDENFIFLNNERLNISVSIEGSEINLPGVNGTDFHLMILPISENSTNFFEILFDQIDLLENLTHSTYINSSLSSSFASLNMNYEENYTVRYEWDVLTGLLVKKTVNYQNVIEFEVIQGIGYGFRPFYDFFVDNLFGILPVAAIIILTLIAIFAGKKKKT